MAPSLKRMQDAGSYFQETMLSPQQKALETADNQIAGEKAASAQALPYS
ncbi:hypothetical protein ACO0LG_06160 [Undibacterium sp. Ji42W]